MHNIRHAADWSFWRRIAAANYNGIAAPKSLPIVVADLGHLRNSPLTWLPRQYLQDGDDPSETYFTPNDGSVELIRANDSGGTRLLNRVRKQQRRQRISQAGSPKARWKFCDARYNPNMVSCFKAFLTVAPQHYSCSIPNYQSRIPRSCGQPEGPGSSSAAAFHAPTTFRIAHPDFGI
jgi:hypothetical protein